MIVHDRYTRTHTHTHTPTHTLSILALEDGARANPPSGGSCIANASDEQREIGMHCVHYVFMPIFLCLYSL